MKKKQLHFSKEKKRFDFNIFHKVLAWIFQILVVCLIAFVIVWYFGQRVRNIGESMRPVLNNADVVLVNRIIYNASIPQRGDIIVFQPHGNEHLHFHIKRIIGLPGEMIEIREGIVYINGEALEEEYETTQIQDAGLAAEPIVLDGDEYFVLGDNRMSSEDSRMADVGTVRRSDIEGKVWFVVSPRSSFGFVE